MRLIGGTVMNPGEIPVVRDVYIDDSNGLICAEDKGGETVDVTGCILTPGFIDSHIHGCFGTDTSDGTVEAIDNMAANLPKFGVAAFCPTTMTTTVGIIDKAFDAVSKSAGKGAKILGIHLEGPFMSPAMGGVQTPELCITPSNADKIINDLEAKYPGLMRIIDVAPECEGGLDFVSKFAEKYVISLAHTEADYATSVEAFKNGAVSVTHLLNAMTTFGKRFPGVPAAAYDSKAFVEIICDGYHIEPPVLRMLFDLYDDDKILIVSDAMRGAGMPDGKYYLADTLVEVRGGRTYFGPNGNLAGSVTNIAEEVERLVAFGVPVNKVIKAATVNHLSRLGLSPDSIRLGYISDGYKGFVNVFTPEMHLINVICR